ncbi:hypothetical protein DV711_05930 [Motiliproteus coralliicola]|uniref:Uncharacterized protein n=1 Tax=Motiliproteus coralliicola TaxID=2283196 RepID=A0A369X000_9GAMM|nr:hypothetical protein [Motiliproteus coralliicola]RDE25095.1 hypothetical protein DV711_05930 [Motiliproteus coralliicola]
MADDDKNDEKPELSPEERLAKLEKGRMFSWIAIVLLLLLVLGEAGWIYISTTQGPDPRISEHQEELDRLTRRLKNMEADYETAQAYNEDAQRLEGKLDRIMETIQLNNFNTLRALMVEQEMSYQQFIVVLQQGMYDISRMVPGSRTWYEVYKGDLDIVIGDSEARSEKLAQDIVKLPPPKPAAKNSKAAADERPDNSPNRLPVEDIRSQLNLEAEFSAQ